MKKRCGWADLNNDKYVLYHDKEWGVPVYDDQVLFEFLVLEGAQAGLSWSTILNKREDYRQAFDNFEVDRVSRFNKRKIESLLGNPKIVRNRLKIESAVKNAKAFMKVQDEFGSFSSYQWQFVNGAAIQNSWKNLKELPTETKESIALSKDLKKRGFSFVGPTIIYAHMQAVGMVNDHITDCFRYKEVKKLGSRPA
jgi:DNA-3-methyladenine glycosylase I